MDYFNIKINLLYSCEIRSWSLGFRQFSVCFKWIQENAAHFCAIELIHKYLCKLFSRHCDFHGKTFLFWITLYTCIMSLSRVLLPSIALKALYDECGTVRTLYCRCTNGLLSAVCIRRRGLQQNRLAMITCPVTNLRMDNMNSFPGAFTYSIL